MGRKRIGIQGCADDGFTDAEGNGCDWYETNGAANCGSFDVLTDGAEMYADEMCCICGGGSSASGFTMFAAQNTASDILPGTMIGD